MKIKLKNKNIFLLALFAFGFFLTLNTQKTFAAADDALCKSFNSNYACLDVTTLSVTLGCQKNKCLGQYASNANVQCCPIDSPLKSAAGAQQPAGSGTHFVNPLRFSTVEGFLGGIMTAIQRIIVVLALVFITIGAVMILVSAGNSGMVEKGKAAITMALVGLAIGIAAPSLLKELANIVGWGGASSLAGLTLSEIAVRVLNFLLGTMGILALIMLVIGAIMYLTSAGDEDRIDKGKEIFKYSLIGLILAMSSMVLVTQIAQFFK
ncbi:MAG: hypothetical protein ACD_9C00296G0003 [uncultured bacterium]|nr:MAG: hypothetical protein ACD_9C00296G0003 [uncultured bacterium]